MGLLLFDSPRHYFVEMNNPWRDHIQGGWGIDYEELKHACDTDSNEVFYDRLITASSIVKETDTIFFDKTPRYLMRIRQVMKKMDIPIIVLYKDPRAIVFSNWKRRKLDLPFIPWLEVNKEKQYIRKCFRNIANIQKNPNSPCLVASLEEIGASPVETVGKMFEHVGIEFKEEYLRIGSSRYAQTKGNEINPSLPFEYKTALSAEEQDALTQQLTELGLSDFFIKE